MQLLADQAAVVLESRALIDEAARVQAREEATRLKDDFLSAAAHDLKTPLTVLLGQAQLLQRRMRSRPDAPPEDLDRIDLLIRESLRMRRDLALGYSEESACGLRVAALRVLRRCNACGKGPEGRQSRWMPRLRPTRRHSNRGCPAGT